MLDSPKFRKKINSKGWHPEVEVLYYELLRGKKDAGILLKKSMKGLNY